MMAALKFMCNFDMDVGGSKYPVYLCCHLYYNPQQFCFLTEVKYMEEKVCSSVNYQKCTCTFYLCYHH